MQPGVNVGALNKYGEIAVNIAGQRCTKNKAVIEKEVRTMIEGNALCRKHVNVS